MIDIIFLKVMHKLFFHPLILNTHPIPLLALLNHFNILIVVDDFGGQQALMKTHLVIETLDHVYPFLPIVYIISQDLADQLIIVGEVSLERFLVNISARLIMEIIDIFEDIHVLHDLCIELLVDHIMIAF